MKQRPPDRLTCRTLAPGRTDQPENAALCDVPVMNYATPVTKEGTLRRLFTEAVFTLLSGACLWQTAFFWSRDASPSGSTVLFHFFVPAAGTVCTAWGLARLLFVSTASARDTTSRVLLVSGVAALMVDILAPALWR